MGQDAWSPPCTDEDGDGYGNPASTSCQHLKLDCDDDSSDDPPICLTCACDEPECGSCARCINPRIAEMPPFCNDGIDNDCDGFADSEYACVYPYFCGEALGDMFSESCQDRAYAMIEDSKNCVMQCDAEDWGCITQCLTDPEHGPLGCSDAIPNLIIGACGFCHPDCFQYFAFYEANFSCLSDPTKTGTECLNEFYDCVISCR